MQRVVRVGEDDFAPQVTEENLPMTSRSPFTGLVVQSVVLLEIARVAHKIVVYRVVADGDVWAGDYVFQVDRLGIAVRE